MSKSGRPTSTEVAIREVLHELERINHHRYVRATSDVMRKRDNELLKLSDLRSELEAVAWIVSLTETDTKLVQRLKERAGALSKAFQDYSEACMWRGDDASELIPVINPITEALKLAANGEVHGIKRIVREQGQEYFRHLMSMRGNPPGRPQGMGEKRELLLTMARPYLEQGFDCSRAANQVWLELRNIPENERTAVQDELLTTLTYTVRKGIQITRDASSRGAYLRSLIKYQNQG